MDYPVKKGQQIELQILRSGDAGCGVAAVEGLTVLVDQTLPGERVLAEITEVRPRFARARAVRVLDAAPGRTTPRCPLYGRCGGCAGAECQKRGQQCRAEFFFHRVHLAVILA